MQQISELDSSYSNLHDFSFDKHKFSRKDGNGNYKSMNKMQTKVEIYKKLEKIRKVPRDKADSCVSIKAIG